MESQVGRGFPGNVESTNLSLGLESRCRIVLLILITIKESDIFKKYCFLIILGGAIGNLFDRFYYTAVPDFIDFHILNIHWFIFNVADIFITMGIACLIFAEIFFKNNK